MEIPDSVPRARLFCPHVNNNKPSHQRRRLTFDFVGVLLSNKRHCVQGFTESFQCKPSPILRPLESRTQDRASIHKSSSSSHSLTKVFGILWSRGAKYLNLGNSTKVRKGLKHSLDLIVTTKLILPCSYKVAFLSVHELVAVDKCHADRIESHLFLRCRLHSIYKLLDLLPQTMGQPFSTNVVVDHPSIAVWMVYRHDKLFDKPQISWWDQVQKIGRLRWRQSIR